MVLKKWQWSVVWALKGGWWPKVGTVVVKKGGGVGRKIEEHCLGLEKGWWPKTGMVLKKGNGGEKKGGGRRCTRSLIK